MIDHNHPRWRGFFDNHKKPEFPIRMLDAIKIARQRFNRDSWRGYLGNNFQPDRRGWRKVILNVKKLCELRGYTLENPGPWTGGVKQ